MKKLIDGYHMDKIELVATGDYPTPPDEAEGITVCNHCGARYQGNNTGFNIVCTNLIPFISRTVGDYWDKKEHRLATVGKDYLYKYGGLYTKVEYKKCLSSSLVWDLQEQKNRYIRFIEFVDEVNSIQLLTKYAEFSKFLTKQANEIVMNSLQDRVNYLEHTVYNMNEAINQIASKMR